MKKVRHIIFLRDVLMLAVSAFGGPSAHIAMMLDILVEKRRYLSERELIELQALCQILPGPTSTQTITAIGFKIGGANLAYLTLLIWCLPAVSIMITAALLLVYLQGQEVSLDFMRFIQPMAVAFIIYAAYKISIKVIHNKLGVFLAVFGAVVSYFIRTPWAFPLILIIGGIITALNYKKHPEEEDKRLKIQWSNFILFVAVFAGSAAVGGISHNILFRLFENFYRNGSLIFGGGQVLIPLLHTEFVDFKHYLTSSEFLSGLGIVQAIPGPVFSFSSYIGVFAMQNANYGVVGQVAGGLVAAAGIFLPGTFLIFFIIRFWDELKKYRIVRASLDGVSAASSGLVAAAGILLFMPLVRDVSLETLWNNVIVVIITLLLLFFTKIKSPYLVLAGLILGLIFKV